MEPATGKARLDAGRQRFWPLQHMEVLLKSAFALALDLRRIQKTGGKIGGNENAAKAA
jgi:hypothetical protein